MTQDLAALTRAISSRSRVLDQRAGEARATINRVKAVRAEITQLSADIEILDRTTVLLTSLGEEQQVKAQQTIEELVTRGLQKIFDETLSFHILQTTRAKAASVEFVVRSTYDNGTVVDTPALDARGGGLAVVIGFLLRLVVMLLRGGTSQDNILVLDETFAMVSAEYLETLGEFLREIVDKTGVQIVMVTHQNEFLDYADKAYRFSKTDGQTQVAEVA
jgi:DNA repair exonuclease SbcCD ATPase subunit